MRILYVLHQFFPEFHGGTERVTLNLARMAQRAGHYVHVLACTVEPDKCGGVLSAEPVAGSYAATFEGLPVSLLPRSRLPAAADISLDVDAQLVESLSEWMRGEQFDVAHVMHTMRMGSAVAALQRCGLPYVLTLTDFFLPCARVNLINAQNQQCQGPQGGRNCSRDCHVPPWTPVGLSNRFAQSQAILQAAGARVAPSDYVAHCYRQAYPEPQVQVQVIAHGIDLLAMGVALQVAGPAPRSYAGLNLIFIGSLVPQKGLEVLLRALALLPGAQVRLKVIGGFFGDPIYQRTIRKLADADPRVELAGAKEAAQVFQALTQSDVLCIPSLVPESYSLVFHESAAAGVPALVSDLGAPAQQVEARACGRVVAAGDVSAWAKAIDSLVRHPDSIASWKDKLFLPLRIEEEAFFYESIYKRLRLQDRP